MTPLDPALTEPLRNPQTVLTALDFAGVAVFAATGALALCVVPASILSEKYGRGRVLVVSALGATAVRSARASALNWASTMWCGSRPPRTRTCSAIWAFIAKDSSTCRVSEPT